MVYRDAFLALDDLERDRTAGVFNSLAKMGMGVSKSVLDYDSLLKEEDDRREKLAQKAIENARNDRIDKRLEDEQVNLNKWRESQLEIQREQNKRLQDNDKYDRDRDTLADEKKKSLSDLESAVRSTLAEGLTGDEALKRAAGMLEENSTAKKHLQWQDVQAEINRQVEEARKNKFDEDLAGRNVAAREKTAGAADKRASRPPGAPRLPAGPKPEGLSTGERGTVARIDSNIPSMDRVIDAVKSGKADPGPISAIMADVRRAIGAFKAGDDDTLAEMDATFTEEMNRLFGTAMSKGELQRSARFIPNWNRDDEGLVAMLEVMKRKGLEQRAATVEVAATNIDAKGGDGDQLRVAFGYAPKGKKAASSVSTKEPPPIDPGEKKSAYAKRLFEAGFSEEEIMKIVMGQ